MIKTSAFALACSLFALGCSMAYEEGALSGDETSDAGRTCLEEAQCECRFYADPHAGDSADDGTSDASWGSLESVFAAGHRLAAGDVLCLRGGNHGAPRVIGQELSDYATILALPGADVRLSGLYLERSSYLVFDGLFVDGSLVIDPMLDEKEQFLVLGDQDTNHIVLRNMSISSAADISDWTKDDWYRRSMSGIDMRGPYITVEDSEILNTYHAVSLRGDHSHLRYSDIDNFAGDAIRGLGSFSTYEFNIVSDAYVEDYAVQHDDLFQAYRFDTDPRIEGVAILNNEFLQFTDQVTDFVSENELVSHDLQGIIVTDGYADGWLVENNLVVLNHPHGISLYGARGCRVQNNTVIQAPGYDDADVPWIRLTTQTKTGQKNFDNVIRNNLASKLTTWEYDSSSIVESNTVLGPEDYRQYFFDYDGQDFSLSSDSPAIDAGDDESLSALDLDGNARLSGVSVDRGAYEYQHR